MKKKASNFKRLLSQKIKILHTQKVDPGFNFYRALHFDRLNTSIFLLECFLQRSHPLLFYTFAENFIVNVRTKKMFFLWKK